MNRIFFAALCLGALMGVADAKTSDAADTAFWKSVYEEHHVVSIDIVLTKKAWFL